MIWAWTALVLTIIVLIAIDLAINRRLRDSRPPTALAWAIFYLGAAAAFNFALFFAYEANWAGLGQHYEAAARFPKGPDEASLQFVTAFLTELALDLDTVFVLAAIFTYFKTPMRLQRRVLLWGVLVALLLRGTMIGTTGWLLNAFDWVRFVLAGLLVLATLRMILIRHEKLDPGKNPIVWLLRKLVPMSDRLDGSNLIARVNGKAAVTPLLVTLVMIETADAIFAIDSIPAVYSVTRDPFIVFAATAFSLLVVRSLYFLLASYTAWLRYMKIGLALILAYSAVTIALPIDLRIPTQVSLAVVAGTLGAALVLAMVLARRTRAPITTSPLGEDAERIARLTLKQTNRLIVLVVGSTVVLIGLGMTIGPGPGALVIPIGLAVLASEFLWARRLLTTYATHAQRVGRKASGIVMRFSHPLLIPVVLAGIVTTFYIAIVRFDMDPKVVIPGSLPLLVGAAIWSVATVRAWRTRGQSPSHSQSDTPALPIAPPVAPPSKASAPTSDADGTPRP
jgi:tellurite resistance protein TerC